MAVSSGSAWESNSTAASDAGATSLMNLERFVFIALPTEFAIDAAKSLIAFLEICSVQPSGATLVAYRRPKRPLWPLAQTHGR